MRGVSAAALVLLLVLPATAHAADRTPPKLVKAEVRDADHDGRADAVLVTFSERIRHTKDTSKPFPLSVAGYTVKSVGAASGKTVLVKLAEKAAPDYAARPKVTYKRTTSKPVRDRAGNQARAQRFSGTLAHGRDRDGDGHPSPADCAPDDGAVHPGVLDIPEPSFVDANCDGVDGDAALAIFVSPTGANTAGCGARVTPCQTVQIGLQEAVTQAKRDVYLAAGTYSGSVGLAGGINVYGGFSSTFARSAATTGVNQSVTITGALDGVTGNYVAVRAISLLVPTILADVRIVGPNASGAGASSYGIIVQGSTGLTLTRLIVQAGDGVAGSPGANGTSGTPSGALIGGAGENGAEPTETLCNITDKGAGGPGAANGLVGPRALGGNGGPGGTLDTDCGWTGACAVSGNCDARPGSVGSPAGVFSVPSAYGLGGALGSPCVAPAGTTANGLPGLVTNGAAGSAGAGSKLTSLFWFANAGTAGAVGDDGTGGGGGGGGGGCDDGADAYGSGGGGGGAGGQKAPSAGGGGGGGGGSFAIYATGSTFTVTNSVLTGGQGGTGGAGGSGGLGQPGGAGGPPGLHPGSALAGTGGAGAHGGHSGGGGGGAGGISFLIYSFQSTVTQSLNTFTTGTLGAGGAGGAAVGDGNGGPAGNAGLAGQVGVCAALGGC
jgi:hypothetical protein